MFSVSALATPPGRAPLARSVLSVLTPAPAPNFPPAPALAVMGARGNPSAQAPADNGIRLHEKYFERREIKEAIEFAETGGIAVHRNFDSYHGSTIRGFTRHKPVLPVIRVRP